MKHKTIQNRIKAVLLMICCFMVTSVMAQTVSGPSPVQENTTATYTYNDGLTVRSPDWNIAGGTELSTSSSGTAYSVVVQWGNAGVGTVTFLKKYTVAGSKIVSITQPAQPGTVSINSVRTTIAREASTSISSLANNEKIESVGYIDGLGRPSQQVAIRAGGNSQDIISHVDYDEFGRQVKEYLPYSSSSSIGSFRPSAKDDTHSFYDASRYNEDFPGMTTSTINPYSEKAFDNSPLNRVEFQAAPGDAWKMGGGHEIKMEYSFNSNNEVRKYVLAPGLTASGYYAANELIKTITKDENWDPNSGTAHTTEEFKDKQGRVVLKRTYGASDINRDGDTNDSGESNTSHDTFYVYDDFGNLTFVIPPLADGQGSVSATELEEVCYQYKYDERNRLIEKKIPGKGWEYIVYDNLDRPVCTQDEIQRNKSTKEWLVTKYDVYGRVAFTGLYYYNGSRAGLQGHVISQTGNTEGGLSEKQIPTTTLLPGDPLSSLNYTNSVFPYSLSKLYTVNYYDNYTFDTAGANTSGAFETPVNNVKGLVTGTKVRVLETNDWITTVNYYDAKSRPLTVYSKNEFLNTTDKIHTNYGFDGRVLETKSTHTRGSTTTTVVDYYDYDHMNRMIEHRQSINGGAQEVLVQNTYDDLGQLIAKGVGGKTNQSRLQTVAYMYNIRGWLTQINDPNNLGNNLFGFKINYNNTELGTEQLFNGNISETIWKTANDLDGNHSDFNRAYSYGYDALNRIKFGHFKIKNSSGSYQPQNNAEYDLRTVNYDRNGNITRLARNGTNSFNNMDYLTYWYDTGNKLQRVVDGAQSAYKDEGFKDGSNTGNDYTYDDNGNMLTDLNKKISSDIQYNHLNLPTYIGVSSGSSGNIIYTYDATGVKLSKKVTQYSPYMVTTTEYAGNYIYEKVSSGNSQLKLFSTPEGYVEPDGSGYNYVYQYKDHLGNVRLSYEELVSGASLIDNNFNSPNTNPWVFDNTAQVNIENNRLKIYQTVPYRAMYAPISVKKDKIYTIKFDSDVSELDGTLHHHVYYYENGQPIVVYNEVYVNSDSYEFHFTAAKTGTYYVSFRAWSLTNSSNFYLDNILVQEDAQLEIVEENNYYPFGLKHKGYNSNVSSNANSAASKYKYNGKELNEELGLDWYDYGARNYDAALGRWMNIDPLAEKYYAYSGYNYVLNNPVFFVDPDGMEVVNADEQRRNQAQNEFNEAEEEFNSTYSSRDLKKSDFNGDRSAWKAYKADRNSLAQKEKAFNKAQDMFEQSEQAINDLRLNDPNAFNALDNLVDSNGNSIDVHVTSSKSISQDAQTAAGFNTEHNMIYSPDPNNSNGILRNSFTVQLNSSLSNSNAGEKLAHEGGHIIYMSADPSNRINSRYSSLNCRDQSNQSHPFVQPAMQAERNYINFMILRRRAQRGN